MAWILRGHRHDLKLGVVGGFRLGGRDVADGLEQTPVAEPVDPFERGELDRLEAPPRSTPVDDLGLVEAVDRFGESVVVGVADTADRWLNPRLGEALGIAEVRCGSSSVVPQA